MELWRARWDSNAWREYLGAEESESEVAAIRQCTHTGRPLGAAEFVQGLEKSLLRRLSPQKGGRPVRTGSDEAQTVLAFNE